MPSASSIEFTERESAVRGAPTNAHNTFAHKTNIHKLMLTTLMGKKTNAHVATNFLNKLFKHKTPGLACPLMPLYTGMVSKP